MKIAYVLLAAGNASRFGACKQLADLNGQPMIAKSLAKLKQLAISVDLTSKGVKSIKSIRREPMSAQQALSLANQVFVVLGANHALIKQVIGDQVKIIHHPDWALGLGSSIAKATEFIEADGEYDAILFALSDQVAIELEDLISLVAGFDGQNIRAAFYSNKPGVPAIFPARYFSQLKALVGQPGAKSILMKEKANLALQVMDNAALDIDYPDDLVNYLNADQKPIITH